LVSDTRSYPSLAVDCLREVPEGKKACPVREEKKNERKQRSIITNKLRIVPLNEMPTSFCNNRTFASLCTKKGSLATSDFQLVAVIELGRFDPGFRSLAQRRGSATIVQEYEARNIAQPMELHTSTMRKAESAERSSCSQKVVRKVCKSFTTEPVSCVSSGCASESPCPYRSYESKCGCGMLFSKHLVCVAMIVGFQDDFGSIRPLRKTTRVFVVGVPGEKVFMVPRVSGAFEVMVLCILEMSFQILTTSRGSLGLDLLFPLLHRRRISPLTIFITSTLSLPPSLLQQSLHTLRVLVSRIRGINGKLVTLKQLRKSRILSFHAEIILFQDFFCILGFLVILALLLEHFLGFGDFIHVEFGAFGGGGGICCFAGLALLLTKGSLKGSSSSAAGADEAFADDGFSTMVSLSEAASSMVSPLRAAFIFSLRRALRSFSLRTYFSRVVSSIMGVFSKTPLAPFDAAAFDRPDVKVICMSPTGPSSLDFVFTASEDRPNAARIFCLCCSAFVKPVSFSSSSLLSLPMYACRSFSSISAPDFTPEAIFVHSSRGVSVSKSTSSGMNRRSKKFAVESFAESNSSPVSPFNSSFLILSSSSSVSSSSSTSFVALAKMSLGGPSSSSFSMRSLPNSLGYTTTLETRPVEAKLCATAIRSSARMLSQSRLTTARRDETSPRGTSAAPSLGNSTASSSISSSSSLSSSELLSSSEEEKPPSRAGSLTLPSSLSSSASISSSSATSSSLSSSLPTTSLAGFLLFLALTFCAFPISSSDSSSSSSSSPSIL
ncbi:hypothetical protein KCU62_g134, partial [Aureobasidium sp. EXF-3399]